METCLTDTLLINKNLEALRKNTIRYFLKNTNMSPEKDKFSISNLSFFFSVVLKKAPEQKLVFDDTNALTHMFCRLLKEKFKCKASRS